jgi:hypothetical protein
MAEQDRPRVALGCIARYIESPEPYQEFIQNIQEFGHHVDLLIVSLTGTADWAVVSDLNDQLRIEIVEIGEEQDLPEDLMAAGAHGADVAQLLDTSTLAAHDLVSYCTQRNAVLLRALLSKIDLVVFFDPTMRPYELVGAPQERSGRALRPVDFLGPHLEALQAGAAVTTGGYSGYDSLPPMQFGALRDLLHGIGREDAYSVVSAEGALAGLHLAPEVPPEPKPAIQAFAGNLGLDLRLAEQLPPFFSRAYRRGDEVVLTRGEDTLLAAAAVRAQIGCTDVGTRVFLDPSGTFPYPPDLRRPQFLDMLYWNCLGWIARLPLLDSVRHASGLLDWSLDELQSSRRLALQQGARELAAMVGDNRFYDLPTFFDLVSMKLHRTTTSYQSARHAWQSIVRAIRH